MQLDNQPKRRPPAQPARRPYSTPRLEQLGGIAQVTASALGGMTTDAGGMGKSGS